MTFLIKERILKQYCRYCGNLCVGDECYCEEKQKTLSESTCKTPNNCEKFKFCEIDAFDITKKYQPKKEIVDNCGFIQGELF